MKELMGLGGSLSNDRGVTVEFDALFANGTRETLSCQTANLAKIIVKLRQIAHAAAKAREGLARPDQLISPFRVTKVTHWGADLSGMVAIELAVTDGMPVQLAMSQDQATSLISALQTALSLAQSSQKPKPN